MMFLILQKKQYIITEQVHGLKIIIMEFIVEIFITQSIQVVNFQWNI